MKPMIGKSIDQSMTINRLILIIDEQSMLGFYVIISSIINSYRLSIQIDQLIVIDWFSFFMRFIFSQDFQKRSLFMHFNDENCDKTLIFFTTVIDTSWRTWAYDFMTISIFN